jgi:hypothetical protein
VVADPDKIAELAAALSDPLPERGELDVLISSGGDDTIDLFEARHPEVVVVTATFELGDAKALIEALRGMAPRAEVAIVVVGDAAGPVRTVLDAGELAPDRFVGRPLAAKALRFAVASALDMVALARGKAHSPVPVIDVDDGPTASTRAALRARWEALADSIGGSDDDPDSDTSAEPAPLPPIVIGPVDVAPPHAWQPGTTDELSNGVRPIVEREHTLIISGPEPAAAPSWPTGDDDEDSVVVAERKADEHWSQPVPLAELLDRDAGRDRDVAPSDDAGLDDFDDDLVIGHAGARGQLSILDDLPADPAPRGVTDVPPDGRDFARQLRAKMSMMAQRLFQGDAASQPALDVRPHHDHQTEIDLASLGEEPALGGGVTEIEGRRSRPPPREPTTSPGSWDTTADRERGLPDAGEIVRGLSDAAMLLARMFARAATGRVGFRRDDVDKVVFFDQGRPVFASSSDARDRMGKLLVREGKITAAQFERCQTQVAESGRRMGEILVDFGYMKRRELLPAVRRHVEDIVYSVFGWDRGTYRLTLDPVASAERIRLSRHPASLILEGIRRKLDRTSLDRLVGSASTVIEISDRERLTSVVNLGDLVAEERAALSAFDGQSDLAQVAHIANVDVTDVLPLAWGLCVLGLATARRADTEVPDESGSLVGETDLAIDRERVRARWQLVTDADYFALLGVRRDATTFEIRRAYQSARRDFAADCFPSDLRRELAQELDDIAHVLDEAFRVLRDDRLRQTYLSNLIE